MVKSVLCVLTSPIIEGLFFNCPHAPGIITLFVFSHFIIYLHRGYIILFHCSAIIRFCCLCIYIYIVSLYIYIYIYIYYIHIIYIYVLCVCPYAMVGVLSPHMFAGLS